MGTEDPCVWCTHTVCPVCATPRAAHTQIVEHLSSTTLFRHSSSTPLPTPPTPTPAPEGEQGRILKREAAVHMSNAKLTATAAAAAE